MTKTNLNVPSDQKTKQRRDRNFLEPTAHELRYTAKSTFGCYLTKTCGTNGKARGQSAMLTKEKCDSRSLKAEKGAPASMGFTLCAQGGRCSERVGEYDGLCRPTLHQAHQGWGREDGARHDGRPLGIAPQCGSLSVQWCIRFDGVVFLEREGGHHFADL